MERREALMSARKTTINRRVFLSGTSAAIVSASSISRGFAQMAPLKVGVILPTSGFLAQIGQSNMRGYECALPVLKEMGYPAIEFMAGDTESSPDIARSAAERLINAGAQVLSGAFDSGQTS